MVSRGTEDAQVIHDALSAIQERAHAAGSEGHTDFRDMSDALYQHITTISDRLDSRSPIRIGSVTMPETPSRRLWINPTLCSMSWSSWPRRRTAA